MNLTIELLCSDVEAWNQGRKEGQSIPILSCADLTGADLTCANLADANLTSASLSA